MLKILWKRGKIAPEEQFLPLSTIFYYLMLDFYVKTGIRFSLQDNRSRDNESRLYMKKLHELHCKDGAGTVDINPIALRKAKTLLSFGLSECNRVKNENKTLPI